MSAVPPLCRVRSTQVRTGWSCPPVGMVGRCPVATSAYVLPYKQEHHIHIVTLHKYPTSARGIHEHEVTLTLGVSTPGFPSHAQPRWVPGTQCTHLHTYYEHDILKCNMARNSTKGTLDAPCRVACHRVAPWSAIHPVVRAPSTHCASAVRSFLGVQWEALPERHQRHPPERRRAVDRQLSWTVN